MTERARPVSTVAMCGLVQAVGGGLAWSVVPALMASIAKDLSLSHAMGGVVWGAAPLGIALAAPAGGAAVDRFGARRVVPLALLFGAAACAARAFVSGPIGLALAMFAFGIHVGFCAPAIPKVIAGHVPIQKLGRANGLALLCYTLATALTVLGASTVAPLLGGWRPVMLVAAGAMAAAAAAFFAVIRDRGVAVRHGSMIDSLRLARNPQLRRLAAIQVLLFGGYLAMLGFLPRALVEAGISPLRVGAAIAGWLAVAALANFIGPFLSDRVQLRRPFILGGAVVAGLALLAMAVVPPPTGIAFLCLAALGGGAFAPLLLSFPLEMPSIGPARAGAALGLLMLVGQLGGFVLPVLAGTAAELGGLPLAIAFLGAIHLAIVIPAGRLQEPLGGESALPSGLPAVA